MFILGHLGLSLGLVYLLHRLRTARVEACHTGLLPNTLRRGRHAFTAMDFRLIFIGAILADIIDKSLGLVLFCHVFNHGRLITHTMVFALTVTLFAILKYGPHLWGFGLSLWLHLVFDKMWLFKETLLWPLYGSAFPGEEFQFADWLWGLFNDPYIYVSELVGFAVLCYFIVRCRWYVRQELMHFLRTGAVEA